MNIKFYFKKHKHCSNLKGDYFAMCSKSRFCIRFNATTTCFAFCQNSKLIFTFLSRTSSSRFGKGHRLWFWVSLQLICNLKKSWLCHLVRMSKWYPKIPFWWNLKFEHLYLILDWRAILMQIKKYQQKLVEQTIKSRLSFKQIILTLSCLIEDTL